MLNSKAGLARYCRAAGRRAKGAEPRVGGAISSGPISASPVKREFNVNFFLPLQKKTMGIFGALGLGYGLGWQAKGAEPTVGGPISSEPISASSVQSRDC